MLEHGTIIRTVHIIVPWLEKVSKLTLYANNLERFVFSIFLCLNDLFNLP